MLNFSSSYPTYEEWKQIPTITFFSLICRSYPTYEEWKHFLVASYSLKISSSYPTYEEWKQYFTFLPPFFIYRHVLILPMRNGNILASVLQAILASVLILPMRNGNRKGDCSPIIKLLFLSYL